VLTVDRHRSRRNPLGHRARRIPLPVALLLTLANGEGAPTTEYTYGPSGETTASGAASGNPYQYTGRENEGNGLQFNRARYYSSTTGRFISQDPLGMEGSGNNLYQYVGSDPIDGTDPSGLLCFSLTCIEHGISHVVHTFTGAGRGLLEGTVGFFDCYSGGLTNAVRSATGLAQPDFSSGSYEGGCAGGVAGALLTPGDEEAAGLDAGEDVVEDTGISLEQSWRGTNMSDEDSFNYHYAKHGDGNSPEQYAQDAEDWASNPKEMARRSTSPMGRRVLCTARQAAVLGYPGLGRQHRYFLVSLRWLAFMMSWRIGVLSLFRQGAIWMHSTSFMLILCSPTRGSLTQ
jgi:RHS repeat-associated protein